jgi:prevent-host-death family protein
MALKTVPSQTLRTRIGEYIDRANFAGDAFVLLRDGKAKAVLISARHYLDLVEKLGLENGKGALAEGAEAPDGQLVSIDQLKQLTR